MAAHEEIRTVGRVLQVFEGHIVLSVLNNRILMYQDTAKIISCPSTEINVSKINRGVLDPRYFAASLWLFRGFSELVTTHQMGRKYESEGSSFSKEQMFSETRGWSCC